MKGRWILIALLPGVSLTMRGLQAKTPQGALEEIATTDKPDVIQRHLPEPIQQSIEALPKLQKQEVLEKLMSIKSTHLDGCTVRRANDSEGWEIIDAEGESKGKVKLASAFISGLDALLPLEFVSPAGSQTFIVTMRLEGDDWRISDFGPWEKTDLGLRKLVHQPTEVERNEAAAVDTIETLMNALRLYASKFPQIGFPSRLMALASAGNQEVSAEHAGILDDLLAVEPLVKDGYLFRYRLTRASNGPRFYGPMTIYDPGEFQIIATPLEFYKTGAKNYRADNQGGIHVTTENREATDDDPDNDPQISSALWSSPPPYRYAAAWML